MPLILAIKIFIVILCAALFWLGGKCWLPARRFIMPFILCCAMIFSSHWCLWAISSLSCMGIFCLGYGEKSPLRHCFGNGWGRGVWGLLAALTLSFWGIYTGHLAWWFFVPYLALNFTLENALKDTNQSLGDPFIGAGFASIVLLIH